MFELEEIKIHSSYVLDLLFTPDSKFLVSAGMDNVINIWNMDEWKLQSLIKGHINSVNSIALSPDIKSLISGSSDKTVKIWSFPDGNEKLTLKGHKKTVTAVDISHDGKFIISGSYEGLVKVWDIQTGEEVNSIKVFDRNIAAALYLRDDSSVAVSGLDEDIIIIKMPSGEVHEKLIGHKIAVNALALSSDCFYLASSGYGGKTIIWSTKDWETVHEFNQSIEGYYKSAFSPDSKILAIVSAYKVTLWSLDTDEKTEEIKIKPKGVNSVVFSPDSNWLVVGAADKKIRMWKLKE